VYILPLLSGKYASETYSRGSLPVEGGQGRCHHCAQSSIRTSHASWGPLGARLGPHNRALSCHIATTTPLAPYASGVFATKSGNASHAALPRAHWPRPSICIMYGCGRARETTLFARYCLVTPR
jgi:hypothetical protein